MCTSLRVQVSTVFRVCFIPHPAPLFVSVGVRGEPDSRKCRDRATGDKADKGLRKTSAAVEFSVFGRTGKKRYDCNSAGLCLIGVGKSL